MRIINLNIWTPEEIMIHLGINPKNGGSPPNENRLEIKEIFVLSENSKLEDKEEKFIVES